ncbi:MAG: sigma-70 family RNA polymerase sigma factor [Planctomycetota bacterium]|nr:sigma-70 family RNA polymerase sigma factor [Planctomycetota bacterium]
MQKDDARPSPEELLRHRSFLASLARSLVGDEHLAQDVVQDAYVAALERPPAGPNVRAWLAAVTRNLARMRRRSRGRRSRHEALARPASQLPTTEEAVQRVELHREVVDAVLRLEEPYRETVILRYFEDRTPKVIAAHQQIPQKTVYTRLARALEALRVHLDRAHGGDRKAWMVPLAALALPSGATAGLAVAAAVLLAVIGAVVVLFHASRDEVLPGDERTARDLATRADDSEPGAADPREPDDHGHAQPASGIRGRILDNRAAPVVGAEVILEKTRGDPQKTTTDSAGEFAVPVIDAGTFRLLARAPGHVLFVGRWRTSPGPQGVDLGDLRLEEGFVLQGRVVDTAGKPVRYAWISIDTEEQPRPEAWILIAKTWASSTEVDENGRFRLDGVPAGSYRITAEVSYPDAFGSYPTREFIKTGVAAGTETVEFRVPPPFAGRRVRAKLRILAPDGAPLPRGSVDLWPVSYSKFALASVPVENGVARIDVKIPTPAAIQYVVHAAQKEPAILHAILSEAEVGGGTHTLRLKRALEIRGRVLLNGAPAALQLFVEKEEPAYDTPRCWLENHQSVFSEKDGTFEIGGLAPGRFFIRPALDEYETTRPVIVAAGASGVVVPVGPSAAATLTGRILPPEGTQFHKLSTGLRRVEGPGPDGFGGSTAWFNEKYGHESRFEYRGVHPRARYVLWAHGSLTDGEWLLAAEMEVTANAGAVELRLKRGRPIAGRVVRGDGTPVIGVTVATSESYEPSTKTNRDGSFRLTGLSDGRYALAVSGTGLVLRDPAPVASPGDPSVRIVLVPARAISGRVRDPAARALTNLQVQLWRPGAKSPVAQGRVSDDGFFQVDTAPGRYLVMIFDTDGRYAVAHRVEAGRKDLSLDLRDGGSILGVIKNADRVRVFVQGEWGIRFVDAKGSFEMRSLPPGACRVWAETKDRASPVQQAEPGVDGVVLTLP